MYLPDRAKRAAFYRQRKRDRACELSKMFARCTWVFANSPHRRGGQIYAVALTAAVNLPAWMLSGTRPSLASSARFDLTQRVKQIDLFVGRLVGVIGLQLGGSNWRGAATACHCVANFIPHAMTCYWYGGDQHSSPKCAKAANRPARKQIVRQPAPTLSYPA